MARSFREPRHGKSDFLHWRVLALGFVVLLAASPGFSAPEANEQAGRPVLRIAAPPTGVLAIPVYRMMKEEPALPWRLELRPWRHPDQLRAMVTGNQVDIAGMPTNVAANLHNRGERVRLVNVAVWKALWVLSTDPAVTEFEHLRGREIVVPLRGDLPEIVFSACARGLGMNPETDIRMRYTSSSLDAVQTLLTGRAVIAIAGEPNGALAIHRSSGSEKPVRRAVDLQAVWGDVYTTEPRIPLAGFAAIGNAASDEELLRAFDAAYRQAAVWCVENPAEAGALAHRHESSLAAEAATEGLLAAGLDPVPSATVRVQLEQWYGVLLESESALIGHVLPSDAFYWTPDGEPMP